MNDLRNYPLLSDLPPTERAVMTDQIIDFIEALLRDKLPMRPLPTAVAERMLADVMREVDRVLGSGEAVQL